MEIKNVVHKIFAVQSDEFRANNHINIIYSGGRLEVKNHQRVCELVDTLELYDQFMLADEKTYLRLLPTALRYTDPNIRMTQELCSKILAMRPEFISHINNRYINTPLYLKYIKANNIYTYYKMSLVHFRDEEFLFHIWAKFPKLLMKKKFQNMFTYKVLVDFLRVYPECEYSHRIYPIQDARFTPEVVEKIIESDKQYMIKGEYRRRFVTRRQVEIHYLDQLSLFPWYIDADILDMAHKRYDIFYTEFAHLYEGCVMDRMISNM